MTTRDGESKAWMVITVGAVTMSIAMTALACRLFTRAVLVKNFGADDWAAIASGVMLLTSGMVVTTNVKNGLGRHMWTLDNTQQIEYLKAFYVSIIFYNVTLLCVKMAFLLQYYRVFAVPKIRRIIVVCMALIGGWSTAQVFVCIFTCTPVDQFWDHDHVHGTCIPNIPQWYINAAGSIASDVVIFLLPMPVLKNMNLRRSPKLIVMGIFSLGFFTVAISVIRIKYLHEYTDHSWQNVASSCWSVGELSSAVTCLCLPTLRPLLLRMRPRIFSLGSSNNNNNNNNHKSVRGSNTRPSNRSSFRSFFKHSNNDDANNGHTRTGGTSWSHHSRNASRNATQNASQNASRAVKSRHSKHFSQDTTVGRSSIHPSVASQDDPYGSAIELDSARGRGLERQSTFDRENMLRGYCLLPRPDGIDGLVFPDRALSRDAVGLQGIVTTIIAADHNSSPDEVPPEPPMGQIAVHRDLRRESSPWRE